EHGRCEAVQLVGLVKGIPSVRPCVQSPMPFGFASPLGHVSQGTSRVVGLGDVSRHFCRTVRKPFPSVWEAFGTAFMMRSGLTVRAASLFSDPPRCVAARIAAQAKR